MKQRIKLRGAARFSTTFQQSQATCLNLLPVFVLNQIQQLLALAIYYIMFYYSILLCIKKKNKHIFFFNFVKLSPNKVLYNIPFSSVSSSLLYPISRITWPKVDFFSLLQLSPHSPSHHHPASVSMLMGRAPPWPMTTPMMLRPLTWLPLPSWTCPRAAGRNRKTSAPNPKTK